MTTTTSSSPRPELWFYQKQHIFKPGFYGWQIIGFVSAILGVNYYLATSVFPKPSGGVIVWNVDENIVLQTFLWYATVLFLKTMAMPWIVVYFMCENNSFNSKNPEDYDTGVGEVHTDDPMKDRFNRVHKNDLENVPFMILMGFFMVLVNPDVNTAILLYKVNVYARLVHTGWYSCAGSHEVRATLWTLNVFCMVAYTFQILLGIGYM
jgi:glutathione S-transferase